MTDLDSLLARCRQGDPHAWEALVRRYQARVYGCSLHYLHDPEEAKDAAQEIFLKLYQHLSGVRDGQSFLPWMLRLSRNCCIDRIRSGKARTLPAPTAEPVSPASTPEESLLQQARLALFYRALSRLTATSRQIVLLKEIEQLRLSDISARLGVPLGTVKSRSNRARVELAKAVRALP